MDDEYQQMMINEIMRLDGVINKLSKHASTMLLVGVGVYIEPELIKIHDKIVKGIVALQKYRDRVHRETYEMDE